MSAPHEQALRAADLIPGLPLREVEARLKRGLHQSDQGRRALAFYLADIAEQNLQQLGGFHQVADYALARLDLEERRTREYVRVGKRLMELTLVDRAFLEGRIGWAKVLSLVQIVTPEHEEAWVALATSGIACRELDREIARAHPGGPPRDPSDKKGLAEKRFRVSAKVPALTEKKLQKAKQKLADARGGPLSEAEFLDTMSDIVLSMEPDGTIPGFQRVKSSIYKIVVRLDEDDLLVDTDTMGAIPVEKPRAEMVRCDAEVVTMNDEPPAKDRPTPAWLRAKVLTRDGFRCRCCGSYQDLHAHHIRFRKTGGPTKIRNLITLCGLCHGLVHEELLFLEGERASKVRFVDGDGNPVKPSGVYALSRPTGACAPTIDRTAEPIGVRFDDLPEVADGTWWRRHAALIRMKQGTNLEFVDGRPSEVEEEVRPVLQPQPDAFDDLVAQDRLIDRLQVTARGSEARGLPFPHTLFQGPAGTGKTTLAGRLTAFLGRRMVRTSGPLLQDVHALIRMLADLRDGDVLFLDEIHAVPRPVLEALYEALAERQITLTFESGARTTSMRFELPPFTLLAATTEGHALHDAMRSRFGLREHLGFFEAEALEDLVTVQAEAQGVTILAEAAGRLAACARGTPREALNLVERVLDDAAASRRTFAGRREVERVLGRLGFDARGLAQDEQRYLRELKRSPVPIPLSRLARLLGETAEAVASRIEPFLFRLGLVATTPRGRVALGGAQVVGT